MATRASEPAKRKGSSHDSAVLGRSAATGRLVLKPASKPGKVSLRDAKDAVRGAFKTDR